MTKKEYREKIEELDRQKEELRDLYIKEHAQAKVGDKVEVYEKSFIDGKDKLKGVAICAKISDKYFWGDINYRLVKIKKDGTASQNTFYAFDPKLKVID